MRLKPGSVLMEIDDFLCGKLNRMNLIGPVCLFMCYQSFGLKKKKKKGRLSFDQMTMRALFK